MDSNKNIGTLALSGLITGSILGSGIVLLPPLAFKLIGNWAVLAWSIIMVLGIVFAYVFMFLSIESPGNEGIALKVGDTLGSFWRELTSNFLSSAVFFGPTAVMLTASSFIKNFSVFSSINISLISIILEIICISILAFGINTLTKFTFIITAITSILLFLGSLYTIFSSKSIQLLAHSSFNFPKFNHTLLLLFWAIIGWEVVGNYIEDIKNPKETLSRAMNLSLIIIISLYMLCSVALQSIPSKNHSIVGIMVPLFRSFASPLISIIALCLCICTCLMVLGGVSRMNASRAKNKKLPHFLCHLNKNGSPIAVLIFYFSVHCFIYFLVYLNLLTIDTIVTSANIFFLSNALIGLITGFKLLKNINLRIAISLLILAFIFLILKGSFWNLILLFLVFAGTYYKQK
ncbi:MAG: amino acid permease [Clostridium sp.]|nr:amino acid permease [Clostridium sp.]